MRRSTICSTLLFTFAFGVVPSASEAQIQASERAVVGQTIDGTTLMLEYSRPLVRGRQLFGGIVPWDVVWTPGANWATTLDVDRGLRMNGVEVPVGKYSVWAIPRADEWLVMLNPDPEIFHFMKPDSTQATVHIPVVPEEGAHTEMLTWSFSEVRGDFATLALAWGDAVLPIQIEVEPTRPVVSADEIAMYVGQYDMEVVQADPTWPTEATLDVFEEGGSLRARMSFTIHPVDDEVYDLVPAGGSRFNPGLYHDGEFFNVEMGVGLDFVLGEERATGFALRAGNGMSLGKGTRVEREWPMTREEFLRRVTFVAAATMSLRPEGLVAAVASRKDEGWPGAEGKGARVRIVHPDPRPGIDGSGVLDRERLAAFPEEIRTLYDMVREIPQIADGIGCACGCAAMPGYRSLLTCYSEGGMAMGCTICQGEGRLAYRRFQDGASLDEVRRAIDARFGQE